MFICGGIKFNSLEMAIQYADNQYKQYGIILGIERV
jgi:hypothetical protein